MLPSQQKHFYAFLVVMVAFSGKTASRQFKRLKQYDGYQVFRVPAETDQALLESNIFFDLLQVDVWKHPSPGALHYDVMVPLTRRRLFEEALNQINLTSSLLISDVQRLIDQAEPNLGKRRRRQARPFRFSEYHHYRQIVRWMKKFVRSNHDIVSILQVGTTFEGRRILALKIGLPRNVTKPVFWQDGLIHAREWITGATLLWVANKLVQDYRDGDAEATRLLEHFDWQILPVWNIDGYRHTWLSDRLWRKSRSDVGHVDCKGVDLNRNFLTPNRGAGTSSDYVCSGVYHGSHPFSEIETLTVATHLRTIPIAAFITLHSYAQYWLYPYGYKSQKSLDHPELDRVSKKVVSAISRLHGTEYREGTVEDLAYVVSGGSVDWAHRSLCVKFAFGVELRDQGTYGFLLPRRYILPTAKEYYEGMKVVARELLNKDTSATSTVCRHLVDNDI